jgi:serine/threonine protein kinase
MSPEQAQGKGKEVGPAVDVYALGAILYECLTGRPPYKGPTTAETLLQVLTEEPVPPRHLQPKVPHDLETICLKCLEKEPERRYAGAGDLADDLQRFLEGRPIQARRTPRWERVWKWRKRHPATASGVVAAIVLLFAGVWYWDAYRREKVEYYQWQVTRWGVFRASGKCAKAMCGIASGP